MIINTINEGICAEMQIFPSLLTQDDRDKIEVYLTKKFSLIDLARHNMLRTYAREE